MLKKNRQDLILQIINDNEVDTHQELIALLNDKGIKTTQATISRDIRELGLTKISYGTNKHKYVAPESESASNSSYKHVLASCLVSMEYSENIIVIKTVSGMAMAAGATIDALDIDGIMGCIAGDDTLFLAIRNKEDAPHIIAKIRASSPD